MTPGTRLDAYEIVALLGAGGMGEVYHARDTTLGRDVAIKILPPSFATDPERVARFRREAQVLASLNHAHIAHIYGLEEVDGVKFLVMELVDGETLTQRIARGPMPVDEAVPIARQIAEALEAAHEKGIIHRDLKPANIALTQDGQVKVLDFGLAKVTESIHGTPGDPANSPTITSPAMMTGVGVILGTAAYMAPEQARGRPADKRCDIWAFGCVLYEMLTGRRAFEGEHITDTVAAVVGTNPDWQRLPSEARGLRRLIARCLNKDPKSRLQAIGDARVDIEEWPGGGGDAIAPTASPHRTSLVVAGVALVAIALVVVTGLAALWRSHTPSVDARPIWFDVRPLEGYAIGPGRNAPQSAIAPDGQQLIYAAAGPDGTRRLWLHRFESPAPTAIAGTDGGATPFWSPDSRSVAFHAAGKLRKVDIATGNTQNICDAPAFAGGTWNLNGDIVLAVGRPRLLARVRAVGGTPVPLTTLDRARHDRSHEWPHFLPDGRHVLFHVNAAGPGGGIFVLDVDGAAPPKRIRDADTPAVYASTGHILFAQGTTLLAQAFDLRRLDTVGDPVAIASGVSTEPTYSIAPAGVLAFRPSHTEPTQLTWFSRQGQQVGTIGAPAGYQTFSLAPDERQVAAEITDGRTGQTDISLIDTARAITSRFTFTHGPDEMPIWSADGTRIVFASHRDKGGAPVSGVGIFVKPVAGGSERPIATDAGHSFDWSADGRYVLYMVDETAPTESLSAMPTVAGEKPFPIVTDPIINHAQFSPDGHWIAYSSDRSGRMEVYVTAFPSAVLRWQISSDGGEQPRWPRHANEVIYLAPDGRLMAVPVKTAPSFEAGTPKPLFGIHVNPLVNRRHQYAVSADGQRFLVNALAGGLGSHSPMTVVLNWQALLNK